MNKTLFKGRITLLFILFLFSITIVQAEYWDYLTIGQGDRRYCMQDGDCVLNNLTILDSIINATLVHMNVTGNIHATGNITSDMFFMGDGSMLTNLPPQVHNDLLGLQGGTQFCYQEFANISTACGGLSTGVYNFSGAVFNSISNWNDGNYVTNTFGEGLFLYVNYTKPSWATSFSLIQYANGNILQNFSIPTACWDFDANKLSFRIEDNWISVNSNLTCWSGVWETIYYDATAGGQLIEEEAMFWGSDSGVSYWHLNENNYHTLIGWANNGVFNQSLNTTDDVQFNNLNVTGDVTADEYFGLFNWFIYQGDSERYLFFNRSHLLFNETELNKTIDAKINTIVYNATSVTVVSGTLTMGNLASIQTAKDGNSLNVTEAAGANPLTIIINYTGVAGFSTILLREWYEAAGGHTIKIGLEECDDAGEYEEEYDPDITDQDGFAFSLYNVLDSSGHVCGGNVSVRLRHVNNGIPSHKFHLDYAVLQSGATTVVANEVDPLAMHKSGDTVAEGNFDWGGYNISNLDRLNVTDVAIGEVGNVISDDGTNLNLVSRSNFITLGSGTYYLADVATLSNLYGLTLTRPTSYALTTTGNGIFIDQDAHLAIGESNDLQIGFNNADAYIDSTDVTANDDLLITDFDKVDVENDLHADDYFSGDGSQGLTATCWSGSDLVFKDGLMVGGCLPPP